MKFWILILINILFLKFCLFSQAWETIGNFSKAQPLFRTSIATDDKNNLCFHLNNTFKFCKDKTWKLKAKDETPFPDDTHTLTVEKLYNDSKGMLYNIKRNDLNECFVSQYVYTQWIPDGAWQPLGSSISSNGSWDVQLIFDKNDVPHIVYHDSQNFNYVCVKKFDGNDWILVGNYFTEEIQDCRLVFDSKNVMSLAYIKIANNTKTLMVKKMDINTWNPVGNTNFAVSNYSKVQLIIDRNDSLIVGYDHINSGYVIKKFDGVVWNQLFASITTESLWTSIAIYDGSKILLANSNPNNEASILSYNNYSWDTLGTKLEGFSPELVVDGNQTVYVLFKNQNNSKNDVRLLQFYNNSFLPTFGHIKTAEKNYNYGVIDFTIANNGNSDIDSVGICWNTNGNPTIKSKIRSIDSGYVGNFKVTMTNLLPSSKYYVRAFAVNKIGINYSEEIEVTTSPKIKCWTEVQLDRKFENVISLGSFNNCPVIAYADPLNKNLLNVIYYFNKKWIPLGTNVLFEFNVQQIVLLSNNSGNPSICYSYKNDMTGLYNVCYLAFDGKDWSYLNNLKSVKINSTSSNIVCALDKYNFPHIGINLYNGFELYTFQSINNNFDFYIYANNLTRGLNTECNISSMTFDNNNVLQLSCIQPKYATPIICNYDTEFTKITYDLLNRDTRFLDICVDNLNIPYIIYNDTKNGDYATVKQLIDKQWNNIGKSGFSRGFINNAHILVKDKEVYSLLFETNHNQNKDFMSGPALYQYIGSDWIHLGEEDLLNYYNSGTSNTGIVAINDVFYLYFFNDMNEFKLLSYQNCDISDVENTGLINSYEFMQDVFTIDDNFVLPKDYSNIFVFNLVGIKIIESSDTSNLNDAVFTSNFSKLEAGCYLVCIVKEGSVFTKKILKY